MVEGGDWGGEKSWCSTQSVAVENGFGNSEAIGLLTGIAAEWRVSVVVAGTA